MTRFVEIGDARHAVRIAPELGAGIAAFDALTPHGAAPILRPLPAGSTAVLDLGCNLMVPFCNRISGGGFAFGGAFHPLSPNLEGERCPIHGDGFQAAWTVAAHDATAATLTHRGALGDFDYEATVRYALENDGLRSEMTIVNRGMTLPFGGGFHPWFPRDASTRLQFRADAVWTVTSDQLSDTLLPIGDAPDWNFAEARALPETQIDNPFVGWDGSGRIVQNGSGIALSVAAPPPLDVAHVYSPGPDCGFFCFEPASHIVDAHNSSERKGLVTLDADEHLTLAMTIGWDDTASDDA